MPDLSVVDNLLLSQSHGFLRRAAFAEQVCVSRRFGLALRPHACRTFRASGSVEIVKCLMRQPRLLVLDEPTAVLLPEEITGLLHVCERVAGERCGSSWSHTSSRKSGARAPGHSAAPQSRRRPSEAPAEIDRLVRAMIGRGPKDVAAAAAVGATPGEMALGLRRSRGDVVLRVAPAGATTACRGSTASTEVRRGEIVGIAGVGATARVTLPTCSRGEAKPLEAVSTWPQSR